MKLTAVVLATFSSVVNAGDFLEVRDDPDQLAQSEVQNLLLQLYDAENNPRVNDVLRHVRPMYTALPKNKHGRLDASTVRYAVHRYFVQRYGWYVAGLDPQGGSRNSTVSDTILKERAPAFIGSLFGDMLGDKGFGDKELAVFATTVADLIHREASMRLQDIHSSFKFGRGMSEFQSRKAIKVFLAELILGAKVRSEKALNIIDKNMWEVYSAWDDTLMWASDMCSDYDWREVRNPFVERELTFEHNARFLHTIQEHYDSYQNLECQALKSALVEMEHEGTGRVRLNKFYVGGLDGDWKFTESTDYLRNLGVLDETNPDIPTVVIPNYLTSQTNCVSSSKFYSVCCSDECEGLMLHVESRLEQPRASPAEIIATVSSLPSDTVAAPRNLSAVLVTRLDSIAAMHDGLVPLHGRLFAQWMHHTYPRECPFPHMAGAISPITPDEWITNMGSVEATMEDMLRHNRTFDEAEDIFAVDTMPWTMEEELVAQYETGKNEPLGVWGTLRTVMAVVVLVSILAPLLKAWKGASDSANLKSERVLV